jgi:hypothetical protein
MVRVGRAADSRLLAHIVFSDNLFARVPADPLHDVIDNKGSFFGSNDVVDNDNFPKPAILLKHN